MAFSEFISEIAEGNPGAYSICMKLDKLALQKLKNMHITGSMVWIAYKDICNENIEMLKDKIFDGTIEKLVKATDDYKYLISQHPAVGRRI